MDKPLISIVMVNYNHDDFLKESIDSVLQQTYDNWELIIVDDGSTDTSVDIVHQYVDSRIKLYEQKENMHICVATNIGLSHIKGEYVARLDSDDIWEANKLEKQLKLFQQNPDVYVCFTKLDIINEQGDVINAELPDLYSLYNTRQESRENWIKFFFFHGNSLIQSTMMMKREVVDKVGGFNLAYVQAHDFDFFIRVIKQYDFSFLEEPLIGYRRTLKQNSSLNQDNNRRFYNEHMNIRYHFFDEFDDELFVRSFQNLFVNSESRTHEELLCEQAFLLCKCVRGNEVNPLWGVMKLEELLRKPSMMKLLKEKFNYSLKDYYVENTKCMFYTDELNEEKESLINRINDLERRETELEKVLHDNKEYSNWLEQVVENKNQLIETVENSTSWKLTKPLRAVGRVIRRK